MIDLPPPSPIATVLEALGLVFLGLGFGALFGGVALLAAAQTGVLQWT